jgi:hypothetical protein
LIAAGTCEATEAVAPDADPVALDDDEVAVVDELLLLLPHPTMAAAQIIDSGATSQLLLLSNVTPSS